MAADENTEVAFGGNAQMQSLRDGNVGQGSGHEGDTNGDTAQSRQRLGMQVAAVDRSGLQTPGDRGRAHPIGEERREGDGGG